jgi:acyl carrier protein
MDVTLQKIEKIKQWLLDKNPELNDIDMNIDILNNRLIDSLQFMTFLLFIEEVRGQKIPADHIALENFQTLRAIKNNFLSN